MEARLVSISKELARVAIDAYFRRPTFSYVTYGGELTAQKVYNELLIGAKHKKTERQIAASVAKVSIISHWHSAKLMSNFNERSILYHRATDATLACLKKIIKRTNLQRKQLILID